MYIYTITYVETNKFLNKTTTQTKKKRGLVQQL